MADGLEPTITRICLGLYQLSWPPSECLPAQPMRLTRTATIWHRPLCCETGCVLTQDFAISFAAMNICTMST